MLLVICSLTPFVQCLLTPFVLCLLTPFVLCLLTPFVLCSLTPFVLCSLTPFVLCCSWFCKKLSRDLAEDALIRARDDCFLIRESEAQGSYTLSLRQKGVIKHFRIMKRECSGRYCLNGSSATFGTLSSLVHYYSHNCVTSAGELLINPCPIEVTMTI